LKADKSTFRLDNYANNIAQEQWEKVKIRKTTKGWKYIGTYGSGLALGRNRRKCTTTNIDNYTNIGQKP
jgi:hypothetical protein